MSRLETATAPVSDKPAKGAPRLWKLLGPAVLVLVALAIAIWWFVTGQYRESTEDAYVQGNVVAVTAQVGGVVTAIRADDTDYVAAGHPLVQLDDTDARLALARAKAQLAR